VRTLDRYIVRSFLASAGLWFAVFMILRIVVDLFLNMDEFAEQERSFGQLLDVIVTYYGYHALWYLTELGGVLVVAAAAFTLAVMNRTNELTAMLASGVSLRRVVWPVALCSLVISGLILADRELVIPAARVRQNLALARDDPLGRRRFFVRAVIDGTNADWHRGIFRPSDGVLADPVIYLRTQAFENLGGIHARQARFEPLDGRRGWRFRHGHLVRAWSPEITWEINPRWDRIYCAIDPRHILHLPPQDPNAPDYQPPDTASFVVSDLEAFDPQYRMRLTARRFVPDPHDPNDPRRPRTGTLIQPRFCFLADNGQTLGIYAAPRAVWRYDQAGRGFWRLDRGFLFYPTDLTVRDLRLRQSSRWLHYMSTPELVGLLRLDRVRDRPGACLAIHVRYTGPLNNLVMLFLGLPFILSRERNIKASATLCLLIVGSFYAFIYACRQMDLPPALAAWLPALLFGPVAVLMFDSVKT
jgi:lipopolysaccharide export LptBFGC system permease protein LptF